VYRQHAVTLRIATALCYGDANHCPAGYPPLRQQLSARLPVTDKNPDITIRPATDKDWPGLWPLLKEVFSQGATYAFDPDISEEEARQVWLTGPRACYVAVNNTAIVGSYYLKPNQPSLGAHVCNAGYVVAPTARGMGLGRLLCLHSQGQARRLGFSAMQFNLVAAGNHSAIHLWRSLGFEEVGRLPKAFRHASLGLMDALIFYKWLGDN